MRFLPPMVMHGAHRLSDDEVARISAIEGKRIGPDPAVFNLH